MSLKNTSKSYWVSSKLSPNQRLVMWLSALSPVRFNLVMATCFAGIVLFAVGGVGLGALVSQESFNLGAGVTFGLVSIFAGGVIAVLGIERWASWTQAGMRRAKKFRSGADFALAPSFAVKRLFDRMNKHSLTDNENAAVERWLTQTWDADDRALHKKPKESAAYFDERLGALRSRVRTFSELNLPFPDGFSEACREIIDGTLMQLKLVSDLESDKNRQTAQDHLDEADRLQRRVAELEACHTLA